MDRSREMPAEVGWLDAEEHERAYALAHPADRQAYVAAHLLLRRSLSAIEPRSPSEWRFHWVRNHQPRLDPSCRSLLRFSLSHARGLVACAVWVGDPVGVNIERLAPDSDLTFLDRQALSAAEKEDVANLPEKDRDRARLRLWTLKEAYAKGRGLGLALPPRTIDVSAPSRGSGLARLRAVDDVAGRRWVLWSEEILDGLLGLAARSAESYEPAVVIEEVPGPGL